METLEKRLSERFGQSEKNRIDADIYAQYRKKNTAISFDFTSSTMTDTRLKNFTDVAFPFADFSSYIDGLISL